LGLFAIPGVEMTKEEVAVYEIVNSPLRPLFNIALTQAFFGWLFAMRVNAKWDRYQAFLKRNPQ
jgi:hypothetical protein